MSVLENLEPKKVLYFFEELSKIPRGSSNEKEVSDYCRKFAEDRGLEVYQDDIFNIVIKKDGTSGKENNEAVILQGHLDMVCEKNKDTVHDFLKEGIKLRVDGDFLSGTGTTLGADNGVAVAIALAILDSDDISHPPLEAVFTAQEETGMDGAHALDTSILKATKMINLDTDTESVFFTSCAGGNKNHAKLNINYVDIDKNLYHGYMVQVKGLKGGHSGVEIDQERGNANKIAFRIMNKLFEQTDLFIYDVDGGAKDNAIPRECQVSFMIKKGDEKVAFEIVNNLKEIIENEYKIQDAGLNISMTVADCVDKAFSKENTKALIHTIILLPNGVSSMSTNIEGLVETSNNVGVIKLLDGKVEITSATRSSTLSKKEELKDKIKLVYETFGLDVSFYGDYPAWEYKEESILRPLFSEVHEELFGVKPTLSAIHAGLECGLIIGKMPNLDIIAIGATILDAHTPDERVSISSIEKTYKLVKTALAKL